MALGLVVQLPTYPGRALIMRSYTDQDFHGKFKVGSQSENFLLIYTDLPVTVMDLEDLLVRGLQCCGVSGNFNGGYIVCCLKTPMAI